ncbi:MAG: hypothetical protein JNM97_17355, partial [Rhodoferax sp.]|nr:hypothetical protein [Rhodoferax sp.]
MNKGLDIMQLPSVDRQPGARPAGAALEPSPGHRVVPVQPVNPPEHTHQPGVVNNISENAVQKAEQAQKASEAVFRSVQDPVQRSPNAERPENDWTIKRPQPQKVEDPPPEPIS